MAKLKLKFSSGDNVLSAFKFDKKRVHLPAQNGQHT